MEPIFFMVLTLTSLRTGEIGINKKVEAYHSMEECDKHLGVFDKGSDLYVDKNQNVWKMKFECYKGEYK